jgi:D-glycero-D-manno-heptose 1,7-bisphosphate phosphatase
VIDAFYYCPDHPDHPTPRRKPADGMLREACADFGADPARTPMVGDDLRDLQAAVSLGCAPYLVMTGKGMQTKARLDELSCSVTLCDDLLDASRHIVLKFFGEKF